MKVLITGFDPFGGEAINPALEAVKLLPNRIGEIEVIKLEIPTIFGKSVAVLKSAVDQHCPDVVISIGQAGGRSGITPERIAINIDDARIEDNEGNAPIDIPVVLEGENAYFTNLPIKAMVQAMLEEKIPATVSNTAGTFVCNHIMYAILHMIHTEYPNMKGGFIHVPYIKEQVIHKPNMPYMELSDITKALEICIRVAGVVKEDLKTTAGTIC